MYVTHLECGSCGKWHEANVVHNLCNDCSRPLIARYDLEKAAVTLKRDALHKREASLWRYKEVLPVRDDAHIVSLGEGWTPLLRAHSLEMSLPVRVELYIKDEGQNPTQSFKARGMTAAISMARSFGIKKVAVPSAGNAAGAMAAYAAAAGIEAHIFMPVDTPRANVVECEQTGANVTLVEGLITDCAKIIAERKDIEGWFDVSTLKEPYRLEGKKTMGYELAEQFGWDLPDVIIYPTGGGTGLIGMWKAFDEMEQLGWIGSRRPRMVTVQADTCAPIVRAFHTGERFATEFENASTVASGLRVPKAVGDFLILDALRASGGTAIAVSDAELIAAVKEIGKATGIFCAPEGAACLPALRALMADGQISEGERVVLFNTGSGVKYLEAIADRST
jgi:threonine synthase